MQETKDPFAVRHPFIASGMGVTLFVAVVLVLVIGGIVWKIEYGRHVQPRILNIEGQNFRKDFQFQQTLRDRVNQQIVDSEDATASEGQVAALHNQICQEVGQMTGTVPTNIAVFAQENCS